jgi:translation initiation factor 2-alpha kinase 4
MPGTATAHAENKNIEYDIRLILPEHPVFQRNMNPNKRSITKKHRPSSKVRCEYHLDERRTLIPQNIYIDKARAFLQSTTSTLTLFGVDLDTGLLSRMSLNTQWLLEEEAWRAMTHDLHGDDRKYAEEVRKAVKEYKVQVAAANRETGGLGGSHSYGYSSVSTAGTTGAAGGTEWCWLYCVREAKGFLLQL